jgi:hypothetical protein
MCQARRKSIHKSYKLEMSGLIRPEKMVSTRPLFPGVKGTRARHCYYISLLWTIDLGKVMPRNKSPVMHAPQSSHLSDLTSHAKFVEDHLLFLAPATSRSRSHTTYRNCGDEDDVLVNDTALIIREENEQ